jgi:ATP-dependent exoDNAse (exonuclease V) beta subunit
LNAFLHGHEADLSEYSAADIERARVPSATSRSGGTSEGFTIIEPEVQLVSEQYLFGGTIDAPSRDRDGKIVLLDWKTSKAIYAPTRFSSPATSSCGTRIGRT